MLKDYSHLQSAEVNLNKHWFSDDNFDLTLYKDADGQITKFELCYDKNRNEHAIIWSENGGFSHLRVDDGEGKPGRYKMSPILLSDGIFDWERIAAQFKAASNELDNGITDFIYKKIMAFPDNA